MHVLENVYFVYICSIFSLHCFVQFAENKDIVLYCIVLYCIAKTISLISRLRIPPKCIQFVDFDRNDG